MAAPSSSTAPVNPPPGARPPARTAASVAAARTAAAQRQKKWAQLGVVAVVLVVGAGLGFRWWQGRDTTTAAATKASSVADLAAVSGLGAELPPPWLAPTDAPARVTAAGLSLGSMGTAEHYHAHLDLLVDGQSVPVPTDIGVDQTSGAMSYLHTHAADGLVHVEAGRAGQPFTLGQLFTQWNVRLSAAQVGGLKAVDGKTLTLFVNGKQVPGDPARLRLAAHQQIALVYGTAGQKVDVPSSYRFIPGD